MRRTLMVIALMAAACAQSAPQSAEAQQQASVAACVDAATTHDALWQCKGVVATPCLNAPENESTVGMIDCANREGEQWQALLDAEIAFLDADDASRSASLASATAAWANWRQAECAYQASENEGGSLARVTAAACGADLTADRAIALIWAHRNMAER